MEARPKRKCIEHRVGLRATFEGCCHWWHPCAHIATFRTPFPLPSFADCPFPIWQFAAAAAAPAAEQWNVRHVQKEFVRWFVRFGCLSFCFRPLAFLSSFARWRNWRARENGDSGGMKEINMPQYVNDKLPPLSPFPHLPSPFSEGEVRASFTFDVAGK